MRANPEITAKAEAAKELIAGGMSKTEACTKLGLARQTLNSRLERGELIEHPQPQATIVHDGLREIPDDEAEVPVFIRDYSSQADHHFYPIGDLHIGAPAHAGSALDEWLNYLLATSGTSMLNTGDNTNCALTTSVSDTYAEKLTVAQARRLQTELFRPLADADIVDAMIDGNHEERVWRATGDSPNAAVAEALGLNYSRSACVVRYLVGDQSYDVYLRHGTGGGQTMGAAVNRLERQERIIDADIYVSGHTHTQVAFPKNVFVPDEGGGFRRKKRLFVCSGSFVGYEDYAAKAGFAPAHIGAPRVYLSGRRHDMHASV